MNDAQKKLAWFGALGLAVVLIISFVPTAFQVGNYPFRKVDFASEIKENKTAPAANDSREVVGKKAGSGADSSAFLETKDLARRHPDGSFEVLGRLDNSDIRGCSQLA